MILLITRVPFISEVTPMPNPTPIPRRLPLNTAISPIDGS